MSALLINEPPQQVLPSLAVAIGLNEAIVLQQLHYLLAYATVEHDNKKWVYNTADGWVSVFPFFSKNTIIRVFDSLEKLGVVTSEKLQQKYRNQTKFYTINYEKLDEISANIAKNHHPKQVNPFTQNGQMEQPKMSNSDLPKMGSCTFTQNGQMLQKNTNRKQTIENKQESYEHTHENFQNPKSDKTTDTEPDPVKKPKKFITADALVALGVDEQVASDYLATRKTKLTQTALNGIIRQAELAGLSLARALEFACEMGWQSFKADWYANSQKSHFAPGHSQAWEQEFSRGQSQWGDGWYGNNDPVYQSKQIGETL